MSYLLCVLSFVVLTSSCTNSDNQEKMNKSVVAETTANTSSSNSSKKYESIEIKYWNGYNGKVHKLKLEKGQLRVYCDVSEVEFDIDKKDEKSLLVRLIERFYIDKTDSIALAKNKSEDALVSNYSSIEVKVMDKGKLLADQRTQIGSEEYEIEFNPEFIKLYELIQELTSSCEKR